MIPAARTRMLGHPPDSMPAYASNKRRAGGYLLPIKWGPLFHKYRTFPIRRRSAKAKSISH
jgi:hypothetical protein